MCVKCGRYRKGGVGGDGLIECVEYIRGGFFAVVGVAIRSEGRAVATITTIVSLVVAILL